LKLQPQISESKQLVCREKLSSPPKQSEPAVNRIKQEYLICREDLLLQENEEIASPFQFPTIPVFKANIPSPVTDCSLLSPPTTQKPPVEADHFFPWTPLFTQA
jgi:hypothetical protein